MPAGTDTRVVVSSRGFKSATPAAYTTVGNAFVDLPDSKVDTFEGNPAGGALTSLSYTIAVATASLDWQVLGSNDDVTYVTVQASAAVAGAANSSYSATQAVYRYYKVQVRPTAAGVHGTATVRGLAKG